MAFVANYGVANVVEMGNFGLIENDRVFEFAGISHDDAVADNHVFAHVAAVANLAALPDPGRPLDHGPMLDDGPLPHEDHAGDERLADHAAKDGGLKTELQVAANLFKGLPCVDGVLEKFSVIGVVQIEKGFYGKHMAEVRGQALI